MWKTLLRECLVCPLWATVETWYIDIKEVWNTQSFLVQGLIHSTAKPYNIDAGPLDIKKTFSLIHACWVQLSKHCDVWSFTSLYCSPVLTQISRIQSRQREKLLSLGGLLRCFLLKPSYSGFGTQHHKLTNQLNHFRLCQCRGHSRRGVGVD